MWDETNKKIPISTLVVHPELLSREAKGDKVEQSCERKLWNFSLSYISILSYNMAEQLYRSNVVTLNIGNKDNGQWFACSIRLGISC